MQKSLLISILPISLCFLSTETPGVQRLWRTTKTEAVPVEGEAPTASMAVN